MCLAGPNYQHLPAGSLAEEAKTGATIGAYDSPAESTSYPVLLAG